MTQAIRWLPEPSVDASITRGGGGPRSAGCASILSTVGLKDSAKIPFLRRRAQEGCRHSYACAPVLVGVGAAFDIHSGVARQAPRRMRENGLEWLFRLLQEPRRLWWRYGSEFVFAVLLESLGIKTLFRR